MEDKGIYVEFCAHPYNIGVVAFIGTREQYKAFAKGSFSPETMHQWHEMCDIIDGAGGLCSSLTCKSGPYEMIWAKSIEDTATIYHESLHAALDILNCVGVPINVYNQEAMTYLQGYIVEQIELGYAKKLKRQRQAAGRQAAKEAGKETVQ